MAIDADILKSQIEQELDRVPDQRIIAHIRTALVEPKIAMREWDYGQPGEQFPCWIVLIDSARPDNGIAYCEHGFGPKRPWGLIWTRPAPGLGQMSMGMDSEWFETFLEAFFNSSSSTLLPIWQVFKVDPETWRPDAALTGELDWTVAWKQCEELGTNDPDARYLVAHPLQGLWD